MQALKFHFCKAPNKVPARAVADLEAQNIIQKLAHMFKHKKWKGKMLKTQGYAQKVGFSQFYMHEMSSDSGFLRRVDFSMNEPFLSQDLRTIRKPVYGAQKAQKKFK